MKIDQPGDSGVTRSSNSYFRDMATLYKQVHVNVQLYVFMQDPVVIISVAKAQLGLAQALGLVIWP